jgi:hypothetical protein
MASSGLICAALWLVAVELHAPSTINAAATHEIID